jgi:hypothetical protein
MVGVRAFASCRSLHCAFANSANAPVEMTDFLYGKKSISASCPIPTLEVAEAWGGVCVGAGWDFGGAGGGGLVHCFFDGAADEIAGAQADG